MTHDAIDRDLIAAIAGLGFEDVAQYVETVSLGRSIFASANSLRNSFTTSSSKLTRKAFLLPSSCSPSSLRDSMTFLIQRPPQRVIKTTFASSRLLCIGLLARAAVARPMFPATTGTVAAHQFSPWDK